MSSSGILVTGGGYAGRQLQLSWTIKNSLQNRVETNKTTISWTLKGMGGSANQYFKAQNIKLQFDGVTVYSFPRSNGQIDLWQGTVVATGEYTFTHNSDGVKSFKVYIEAGIYYWDVNTTGTATFDLDTIPRASQPSCITWPEHTQNVGNFGDTISIHMNRNSPNFTHTVRYAFGSRSGTIATGVETGLEWTIPASLMDLLPSSIQGSGTIYVDTYQGGTKIGTKYCGFTASVPASVKPSVTFTLDDTTNIDTIYGSPVQNLSKIKVAVKATPVYSSPVELVTISVDGVDYSGTEATTAALRASGASPVVVTARDKRGRTGTASYTMNVQAYTAPAISALTVNRCDANGAASDQGKYIKVTFSAVISSLSGKNTASYALRYKKTTAADFTQVSFSNLANKYAVTNHSYIFAADESSSYDVEVEAKDKHGTATRATSASTAFSLMDWHHSGTGLRFGGVAELANTLQNDLELRQVGNSYAHQPESFNGEKGYTLLAVITLKELNVDAPIVFKINRRGALCPMQVSVCFASSSATLDPELSTITYEGDNFGAFLIKSAASTWKLYVDNTGGWSNPCLQEWYTTSNQAARLSVSFSSEQVATLPTPYYRATPAKMQSLLDYIYPVGSIYLSYSHVDPATLFGGTWTRLQNAFLWAVDANGEIGQTGGSKTHTLTLEEMPAHDHGAVYSGGTEGRSYAWFNTTTGSSLGYDTIPRGSSKAHNNMPPYIQVSAWRRTA